MSTRPHANKLKAAMLGMADPLPAAPPAAEPAPKVAGVPPSRQGKRVVSAYVSADAARQLRLLAAERDATTQALVEEALNDLFRKYNKSAVA